MLFLAPLPMPYGYYSLLRIVETGVFVWAAYRASTMGKEGDYDWPLVFGFFAIMFNPLIPVHLSREIWAPIDIGAGVLLLSASKILDQEVFFKQRRTFFQTLFSPKSVPIAIGDEYQGGIVFYIDETGRHGLVAAKEDQDRLTYGHIWYDDGSGSFYPMSTGATGTSLGTGRKNTEKIIGGRLSEKHWVSEMVFIMTGNRVGSSTPARLCAEFRGGGYRDWFLPSKDELYLLYKRRGVVGGFHDGSYWSSSECNSFEAWYMDFRDRSSAEIDDLLCDFEAFIDKHGLERTEEILKDYDDSNNEGRSHKGNHRSVRAVRAF